MQDELLLRRSLCQIELTRRDLSAERAHSEIRLRHCPTSALDPIARSSTLLGSPCPAAGRTGGPVEWHPAYTVYLGEDWIGHEVG